MNDRPSNASTFPLSCASSLILALALTGCRSNPATSLPDDTTLTQAIEAKLSSDTSLGGDPIHASVQQGIATLNGTVSSDAARSLAANDIAQIVGIRTVVNNLLVQPSAAVASTSRFPSPSQLPSQTRPVVPARHEKPSAQTLAVDHPIPPPDLQQPTQKPAPIEREQPGTTTPRVTIPRPATPPPPSLRTITLSSGTILPVRITQTLDSATTQQGDTFSGVLASDLLSDNLVVLPQGTPVTGRVVTVHEAAHFKGNSLLSIELTSIDRKGDHLPVATDSFSKAGNGRGKNSAEKIGGGAALGAILGGILGGGKGAAIGAAAGGGAGAGVQAVTKGQQVQIESETLVRFQLSAPITVRVSAATHTHENQDEPDLQHH